MEESFTDWIYNHQETIKNVIEIGAVLGITAMFVANGRRVHDIPSAYGVPMINGVRADVDKTVALSELGNLGKSIELGGFGPTDKIRIIGEFLDYHPMKG